MEKTGFCDVGRRAWGCFGLFLANLLLNVNMLLTSPTSISPCLRYSMKW